MNDVTKTAENEAQAAYVRVREFLAGPQNSGLLGMLTVLWLKDPDNPSMCKVWQQAGGAVDHAAAAGEMLKQASLHQINFNSTVTARLAKLEKEEARIVRVVQ